MFYFLYRICSVVSHLWLCSQELCREWIGQETCQRLENYLAETSPFPQEDFFRDMTKGDWQPPPVPPETIALLYQAIQEKKMISFDYTGTDGTSYQGQHYLPFRILLDKEWNLWQLLAFQRDSKAEILCNLHRIQNLTIHETSFPQNLAEYLQENREGNTLVLKLSPDQNSIERSFLLFHDYRKTASHQKEPEEYTLSIPYYDQWDEEDLFAKVLSLGSAVEVLEPPAFREKIIDQVRRMISP